MFQKGHKIWLNKKHTEETKQRMRIARGKRTISEETKLKISNTLINNNKTKGENNGMYGRHHSKETIQKLRLKNIGHHHSEKTKQRMSKNNKGEGNGNWKGGITKTNYNLRYQPEYLLWRKTIFEKDNYTCQGCGDNKGHNLNAHHILPFKDFSHKRLDINNGITLCKICHRKLHRRVYA